MFPANGKRHRFRFRSSGARRSLLEVARSINIASLRDGEAESKTLLKKLEVVGLLHRYDLKHS